MGHSKIFNIYVVEILSGERGRREVDEAETKFEAKNERIRVRAVPQW